MSTDVLARLAKTIAERRMATAETSYTKQLLEAGPAKCARKFGEEAIEVVIAGSLEGRADLAAEAADVLFHLMVLLEARGVALNEVLALLEGRMGTSGLTEKSNRTPS